MSLDIVNAALQGGRRLQCRPQAVSALLRIAGRYLYTHYWKVKFPWINRMEAKR